VVRCKSGPDGLNHATYLNKDKIIIIIVMGNTTIKRGFAVKTPIIVYTCKDAEMGRISGRW
jgi:serine protease inhibitor ecotin